MHTGTDSIGRTTFYCNRICKSCAIEGLCTKITRQLPTYVILGASSKCDLPTEWWDSSPIRNTDVFAFQLTFCRMKDAFASKSCKMKRFVIMANMNNALNGVCDVSSAVHTDAAADCNDCCAN